MDRKPLVLRKDLDVSLWKLAVTGFLKTSSGSATALSTKTCPGLSDHVLQLKNCRHLVAVALFVLFIKQNLHAPRVCLQILPKIFCQLAHSHPFAPAQRVHLGRSLSQHCELRMAPAPAATRGQPGLGYDRICCSG